MSRIFSQSFKSIGVNRILFVSWYIFSTFNQAYLIGKIKYLIELKKILSTELNFHLQLN